MKKIKSIHQLKAKQAWIKQHETELGYRIRDEWDELKATMNPGNLAREAYGNWVENKAAAGQEGDSLLKSTIIYAGNRWVKVMADKATEKIDRLFEKKSGSCVSKG